MSEAEIELARLLARFKLQVKRALGRSVNLTAMMNDPAYAKATLDEIEELADDEAFLLLVICLRKKLASAAVATPGVPAPAPEAASARSQAMRDYRFGARGG
jgi:hypothetical protein